MTSISPLARLAIAALLVGSTGLAAVSPALAQTAPNSAPGVEQAHWRGGPDMPGMRGERMGRPGAGAGLALLAVACAPETAERIEVRLDTVETALELSDEQQPLFDDLKTALLTAQSGFASACADAYATPAEDVIDRLARRQTIAEARVEATGSVLPPLEALYDTLSDAQKLALLELRQERRQGMRQRIREHFEHHRGNRPR